MSELQVRDALERRGISAMTRQHVGAVIGDGESVDVESLVHLCGWAAAAEYRCVSLYQEGGELCRKVRMLRDALDEMRDVCFPSRRIEIRVWGLSNWISHWVGDGDDGASDENRVTVVFLLSRADAQEDFVLGAVKSLAAQVKDGNLRLEDISAAHISKALRFQGPDPQLVLCFDGPTRNGFMPWHIRVTEFFDCGDLCDFRFSNFVSFLEKFARVEQRYGA